MTIQSIASNLDIPPMKGGWFAPQALAWTFFGPISEVPAACSTMKKSDLHDDVQATSASGTELENPKALRCFAAEAGGKMGRAALRKMAKTRTQDERASTKRKFYDLFGATVSSI